jgi:hypothetical protein
MSLADLISGNPIADDSDDGDAPMGSVSGRGASDDEESNKGVDLMGENTGDEDSSEEGEDDSEEEREVRKGEWSHMESCRASTPWERAGKVAARSRGSA